MITAATARKRRDLESFIACVLAPEQAVQAVVGIGSIATGLARPDSDIDAVLFLDPYDPYIAPAESIWRPSDGSFRSIFSAEPERDEDVQLDLQRLDLAVWGDPAYPWPEGMRAELAQGWWAYCRSESVQAAVAAHIAYPNALRQERLDEAIVRLDSHLAPGAPQRRWESLGSMIAHDHLLAAYDHFIGALFAHNRRWRPWRDREMSAALALPWLPEGFAERAAEVLCPPSVDRAGFLARAEALQALFASLLARLVADGLYGDDPVGEAFIRSHNEPGRAWNMEAWNEGHRKRGQP
jgi:hypothetical protein